jgi:DnaJ-domain-containing protein 1
MYSKKNHRAFSDLKVLLEYGEVTGIREIAVGLWGRRLAIDADNLSDQGLVDRFGLIYKHTRHLTRVAAKELILEILMVFSLHARARAFIEHSVQHCKKHWSYRVLTQSWIIDLDHEAITCFRLSALVPESALGPDWQADHKSALFHKALFGKPASTDSRSFGQQESRKEKKPGDDTTAKHTDLIIDCPACAAQLRLPASMGKLKVTCPKCRDTFEVRVTPSGRIHVYLRDKSPRHPEDEDPYVVLQVPRTATIQEIKNAFRKRMQEYHPDRVACLGIHLRALAEEETKRINRAYELLLAERNRNTPR